MGVDSNEQPVTAAGASRGYFITEYLAILQTWKKLAAALLVSIGLISLVTAFLLPPAYESEARLMPVGDSDLMGSSRFWTAIFSARESPVPSASRSASRWTIPIRPSAMFWPGGCCARS
jgi:hypothetical protein